MTLASNKVALFGIDGHSVKNCDRSYLVSLFNESGVSFYLLLFDILFAVSDIFTVKRESTAPSMERLAYFSYPV